MDAIIYASKIPPQITTYSVLLPILEQTHQYFRGEGRRRFEGYLCWSGKIKRDGSAVVLSCAFPPPSGSERDEFYARLDVTATSFIAEQIRSKREFLLAQLHTHPGKAFHSVVDDLHSISQRNGFLSIVVPRFGLRKFYTRHTLSGCSVNEHQGSGVWREWHPAEVRKRIKVVHDEG
jgi:hypothetical protein